MVGGRQEGDGYGGYILYDDPPAIIYLRLRDRNDNTGPAEEVPRVLGRVTVHV